MADCEKCRVLLSAVLQRRFACLLCRVHMKKTPFEKQGEVLKDLNAAELELRQAEDALVEHKHEHAGRDGGG